MPAVDKSTEQGVPIGCIESGDGNIDIAVSFSGTATGSEAKRNEKRLIIGMKDRIGDLLKYERMPRSISSMLNLQH